MNVKDHEKDIGKLLLLPDTRASKGAKVKQVKQYFKGIYIFSRDKDDLNFKIGVAYGAGGIFQRLKNYKICYPYRNEFFLQYAIVSPTSDDAKTLESAIFRNKALNEVEENPSAQGKRSAEWRIVSKKETLHSVIIRTLESNPNLWTHVVCFGQNSWNIIKNLDGSAIKSLASPSNSRTKKFGLYDNVDININEFQISGNETVGDRVPTPWGVGTVVKIHKNKDLEMSWVGHAGSFRVKRNK
jgi:hypothetical protein